MQARGGSSRIRVPIKKQVLDDLCSRFLINLPEDERKDPVKLCYNLELAHWFYIDLLRPDDHSLPACNLKEFAGSIFAHYPPLEPKDIGIDKLLATFKASKARKPLRGAIILNKLLDKCLLVQGYLSSSTWGFPKGKAEEGENELQSAVREVFEETGFNIEPIAKEEWCIEKLIYEQHLKLYIVPGVSEHTKFTPQTRKEIKDIQWFQISSLPQFKKDFTTTYNLGMKPNDFFRIIPFIKPLKIWIENYKRQHPVATVPMSIAVPTQIPPVGVIMATSVSPSHINHPTLPVRPSYHDAPLSQPPQRASDWSNKGDGINRLSNFTFSSPLLANFKLDLKQIITA